MSYGAHSAGTTIDRWSRSRFRVAAVLAGLLALVSPLVAPVTANAAGNGVLTITMEPVDVLTGDPQTWAGMTGFNASTQLGYRVSYSCSVEDCLGATIQISPGPTDPTYNTYRHLVYQNWTAPFPGATIAGTDVTGKSISLGDIAAGASGSFTMSYFWSTAGNANTSTIQPAQFFPNGFPIVMSATAQSSSISNVPTATAAPVEWRSEIRDPALSQSNPGNQDAGATVTYTVYMNSGCLPIRDTAPKGDARYTCAKSYTVTDHLDPKATFVSATSGGVYDAATHTVVWATAPAAGLTFPAPAPGWYAPGSASQWVPRTVSVRYDAASFSPSGTDANFCDFTTQVSNRVTLSMVYLGAGGMSDDSAVRSMESSQPHNVVCVRPFGKATFTNKLSTYDGPNRYGNGNSPIIVQPDAAPNVHRWDITVSNQANVPGVAVIEEPNLAIEGTRPTQIQGLNSAGVQQNDASIAWVLNDSTSGTSMGVANAPSGKWFVGMTVTSGPLAGPNLLATGTLQTPFVARVTYDVAGNAPIDQTRTNTATAKMTYPGYPAVSTIDLGSRSHTLHYSAPFGRGTLTKSTTNTGTAGVISIPASGAHYWSVIARNTGNVPGVAVIEDLGLDNRPVKVTTVTHAYPAGNGVGTATVQYTLNTGATGTANIPFNAPNGTWITSVRVTSTELQPVNALASQNVTGSYYELRLAYLVPAGTSPGTWTNTATATMTYPAMGIANVDLGSASSTVTFGSVVKPKIAAQFVGAPVVEGGGQAVPGRDVTYTVRGTSSDIATDDTFSPQYIFIAPANWAITPGSAGFATDTVPAGVTFTYKTVTIAGVSRQAVLATWPAGVSFGANTTWPSMTVKAQPTAAAAPGSSATATAWAGEASHNWTSTEATYTGAVTDTNDIDSDGVTTEGFATVNSIALTVGSASQLSVVKEICFVDPTATDGCEWIAQPGAVVGVDPDASNIEYRVRLTNSGNTSLTNLVAYDVLPFVGDMGTSAAASTTPRGSTFQETLSEIVSSTGVTLAYSTSTNPCRAEVYPAAPGCVNNWNGVAAGSQAIRLTASAALAPGASVSVHYKAAVVSGATADAIACNSVAAKATQIGVPAEPLAVCASTQEADLEIEVPARLPLQIDRAGVIPFTVTNNGGSSQAPAIVDVAIPAGVQVTSLTPTGWSCVSSTAGSTGPLSLSCTPVDGSGAARTLAKDVPDSLVIPVFPSAGSEVCIEAEVHGRMSDPDLSNNDTSACMSVVPSAPGLDVGKNDARTVVAVGDTYTYTITATNLLVGETLPDVVIRDTLPAGLEFVSASDGATATGGVVTWPAVSLAQAGAASASGSVSTGGAGSTVTRTVTVRVLSSASGSVVNTATASAPDPQNSATTLTDSATDTDQLRKLAITKSTNAPSAGVLEGDEITYTVTLSSVGTGNYTAGSPAAIRDVLSGVLDDATFVAGSARISVDGGPLTAVPNPAAGVLNWSGPLAAGTSAVLTYRVLVGEGADLAISNSAFSSPAGTVCASGADEASLACATTVTPFAPTIAKSILSVTQADNGRWNIVYGIDVANLNQLAPVNYSLADQLGFGSGISVVSASVTAAPAGVTPSAWTGTGTVVSGASIPAGATHHYEVTAVANAGTTGGTAAATCVPGVAGGFGNTVTFTPVGGAQQSATACASPLEPTVDKSAAAVTQNPDGSWTVVYTVTVTAPSGAPADGLAYTLDDVFDFPAGVAVAGVSVSGPAGAPVNGAFDGSATTALLSGADRVISGSPRVYTVTVTADAVAGSVTGSDLACAPAGSGGYANSVDLHSGTSSTVLDSADACTRVVTQPTPEITKSVVETEIDAASGDWTVSYDITVTNPAPLITEYSLDDELQFGDGVTVVSASVASADATTESAWDGAFSTTVSTNVALAASATHVYRVTVVATPPAVIDDANAAAMDCRLDAGESGTGYRNLATLTTGVVSPSPFAVACEPVTDPSVVKTTVGTAVQNPETGLWSIEYQITVTNRSTTSTSGVPYSLADDFGFDETVTVTDVTVTGSGTVNPDFDGVDDTALASGTIDAAADESTPERHQYSVVVQFQAPGGLGDERYCDPAQGPGGLNNEIEITVGGRTTADVACADIPESPVFGTQKSVLSQTQQADGTWLVLYRITVANPSETVAGFYDLNDEFAFGEGIELAQPATVVSAPAGVTVNHSTWNGGSETVLSEDVLLGGNASHQYTVRAVIDSGSVRGTDAAGDCVVDAGETGSGFLNTASVASGLATRDTEACATASDPAVSKTVNGVPVRNADGSWTVSYFVTVTNPSEEIDLSYGLSDELGFPEGTEFVSATAAARDGGPEVSATWDGVADTTLVADGASLPAGAVHVFDVTVVAVLPADQESIEGGWANSATVASSSGGVVTSSEVATADIELPELLISKSSDATGVLRIGDVVTYTVTAENIGVGAFTLAYPAEVWDDLAGVLDDATVASAPEASPSIGSLANEGDRIHWSGALAASESVEIVYSVTVTAEGDQSLVNTAFAGIPGTTPPTPEECLDSVCASTETALAGFLLEKSVSTGVATHGDTVEYELTYTNTSEVAVVGATFTDDLSDVLDDADLVGSAEATAGDVTIEANDLTWTGVLAAGESVTVTYSVVVSSAATGDGFLTNTATSDPDFATRWPGGVCPDSAEACAAPDRTVTTETGIRALAFTKAADTTRAVVGQKITYTVTVTNIGGSDFTEESPAQIVDSMGGVLDDASYNNDGAVTTGSLEFAAPYLTWSGPLEAEETVTFRYSVTVSPAGTGDRQLVNAIGLSAVTVPVDALAECLASPTDNARESCVVTVDIAPLASTGASSPYIAMLVALLVLLTGAALILLALRRREVESRT